MSSLSGLALLVALQSAADGLLVHPRFMVREVEVRWEGQPLASSEPTRFRISPAVSIFRVDLRALAQVFLQRYPTAEVERVERILPNRVVATLHPHPIVAQLQSGGLYVPVSEEGRVVGAGRRTAQPGLPVLLLAQARGPFRVGDDLQTAGFWKASELLASLHRDKGIAGRSVSKVQVSAEEISVQLARGPELKFSVNGLSEGWRALWELLAQRHSVLDEAKYIDLRFEDPVIKK